MNSDTIRATLIDSLRVSRLLRFQRLEFLWRRCFYLESSSKSIKFLRSSSQKPDHKGGLRNREAALPYGRASDTLQCPRGRAKLRSESVLRLGARHRPLSQAVARL